MKKIRTALMVLPFLFVACASESEIPVADEIMVEEVRTCSNVVKVELVMRKYNYPGFALGPREGVEVKLTLENGKYVYKESQEYLDYTEGNKGGLLKTATKVETGKEHCFTDYKPIK